MTRQEFDGPIWRALAARVRLAWGEARAVLRGLRRRLGRKQRVLDASRQPKRSGALLSYLAAPLGFKSNDRRFSGHTNAWESSAFGRGLVARGFVLDGIDWSDDTFQPSRRYRVIVDLHRNLERLAHVADTRWLHVTGSHPAFAHAAERARLDGVLDRRGVRLSTRRAFDSADTARFDRSLTLADVITVIGDAATIETLPDAARQKAEPMYVTGSPTASRARDDDFEDRTFLWFGGSGAVHKGMDLVLEWFARTPELTLHCVGPYEAERDFVAAYARELYATPNIVSHGWLLPSDPRFATIARKASAFVLPSCSEGMSPAAVTCMLFGLIPIVTRRCGLDLPPDVGRVLDDSATALGQSIMDVAHSDRQALAAEIGRVKALATSRHSRAAFDARVAALMTRHLPPADA